MSHSLSLPTRQETEQMLREAEQRNPGPWVQHSFNVGRAAGLIAGRHPRPGTRGSLYHGLSA